MQNANDCHGIAAGSQGKIRGRRIAGWETGVVYVLFDRAYRAEYHEHVIHSFACPDTAALFRSETVLRFRTIERVARRKLLQLHAAGQLASLRIPPGNRLEALKGGRKGRHSIRVNAQPD